jgi:hypothetical protein
MMEKSGGTLVVTVGTAERALAACSGDTLYCNVCTVEENALREIVSEKKTRMEAKIHKSIHKSTQPLCHVGTRL